MSKLISDVYITIHALAVNIALKCIIILNDQEIVNSTYKFYSKTNIYILEIWIKTGNITKYSNWSNFFSSFLKKSVTKFFLKSYSYFTGAEEKNWQRLS